MTITVKPAGKEDLEALYRIERECFTFEAFTKEQIAFLLESPRSVSLVALVNDEIAGFIIGVIYDWKKEKMGHVFTIDVAVKHRRKGVGLRLLRDLEQRFRERGVNSCYLEVRIDNEAAQRLYRAYGYEEVRRLKDYYGKGIHGIQLRKLLANR